MRIVGRLQLAVLTLSLVTACKGGPLGKPSGEEDGKDGPGEDGNRDGPQAGTLAITANLSGVNADTAIAFGGGGPEGVAKSPIEAGVLALEVGGPTGTASLDGDEGSSSTIIMVMEDHEN